MKFILFFILLLSGINSYSQFNIDAVVQTDTSVSYFTKLIKEEKSDPIWYFGRSYAYASKGKYSKARQDLKRGLKLYGEPNDTLFDYQAKLYALSGKYKKALSFAKEVVSMRPDNPFYHLLIGEIYSLKGDSKKAILQFDSVAQKFPNFPNVYFQRGREHKRLFAHDSVIVYHDFKKAMVLALNDTQEVVHDAIFNLAIYFISNNNYDSATSYYNLLIQLDSNNFHLYNLGFFLGESYFYNKNYVLAKQYHEKSLFQDNEKLARSLYMIGRCFEHLKSYDSAIFHYEYSLEIGDKSIDRFSTLRKGISCYYGGYHDIALKDLNRAIKKWHKDNHEPYYYLGMIALAEGDPFKACNYFYEAMRLDDFNNENLSKKIKAGLKKCDETHLRK
ncbi:MAG: tetratricopeptide repeat protein [Cryomorphaceae bacterium]|nr:tetratricopeptide repeat protein [Cryomorphaceae bacterium]